MAIDSGIRSEPLRGFDSICNSGWLPAFELRIRYKLSMVAHGVEVVETLC